MTDFNALIEQHGFGFRTAPCGFGAAAREAKPALMAPRMIPGGAAARELGQQPMDFDHRLDALGEPPTIGLADLKVDGIRGHYVDGMIVSRQGTPLNCARQCLPGLGRLEQAYGYKMFFDGEYLEAGGFDATNGAFKRGEGEGVFWIFDAVPFAQWVRNQDTMALSARREKLEQLGRIAASPYIGILQPRMSPGPGWMRSLARIVWEAGLEGIVFKYPDSLYRRERNADWLRLKKTATVDGTIVDVLQHASADGKPAIVLVRTPAGPVKLTLAGKHGWHEPLEGQGIEIAFNQKAGDDQRACGPRHARFVRFRDDKKEVTHG
jgi:hypothetical protein